ncbi:FAA hydrolase family protein, partial [Francisella tularensis subsp. holarctica]|nr:FAA hydrolase family protein [Francisella tularensis subsp. holarctica]
HDECEIDVIFDNNSNINAVGLGLDLTDRNLQTKLKAKELPWELAKAFDYSAVFSEFVAIDSKVIAFLNFKAYKIDILIQ